VEEAPRSIDESRRQIIMRIGGLITWRAITHFEIDNR
jgi:hypothetical protein